MFQRTHVSFFTKMSKRMALPAVLFTMLTLAPMQVLAVSNDIGGHWAESTIANWQEQGLIHGYADGTFRPNNNVTRAEFVAMINKAMGFSNKMNDVSFKDVKPESWFYDTVNTAVKQGYCSGYKDGTFRPDMTISREEAATMIARAKELTSNGSGTADFHDAVSAWAKGNVGAVVKEGYMTGYPDGTFRGTKPITRAEAVVSLHKATKGQMKQSVSADEKKDVYVKEAKTTIENQTITGNLVIEESVGDGEVTIKNTIVNGDVMIKGGGANSVYLENVQVDEKIIIEKKNVKLQLSGRTTVSDIFVKEICTLVAKDMTNAISTVTIDKDLGASEAVVIQMPVKNLNVMASANITVNDHVENLYVFQKAEGTKVSIENKGLVNKVVANSKMSLSGSGQIDKLQLNVENINIGSGIKVKSVDRVKNIQKPSISGSSSGSSSGGSHSQPQASRPEKQDFEFIHNGIYEGTAAGYRGKIKVKVTVVGNKVISIEVLSHDDDEAYFQNAKDVIPKMIEKQSTNVDAVSNATYSSYGIINAVANALNLKGKDIHIPAFDPKAELADGEWYGTASEGFRYEDGGPSIVKVTVNGGKIQNIESELYTDDSGQYQDKMVRLLDMLKTKTPEEIVTVADQIWKRKGAYYDAVASATYMARGHMSAVEHALERSARSHKDKKDQEIRYMKVVKRPKQGYFGHPLDLNDAMLEVYFTNGTNKQIPFADLKNYGIVANWNNKDVVTEDSSQLESGNNITVQYKHTLSGAHTHMQMRITKYVETKYPDHILVKYQDDSKETIELQNDKARYRFDPKNKKVKEMALYKDNQELVKGRFNDLSQDWNFSLEDVSAGENAQWGFRTYGVRYGKIINDLMIVDFTVNKEKALYVVGELLNLDDISVQAKAEDGTSITLNWEECKKNGFEITFPEGLNDQHQFVDKDVNKELKLSIQLFDVTRTLKIAVYAEISRTPKYIIVGDIDREDEVKKIIITEEDLKKLKAGETVQKSIDLPMSWKDQEKKSQSYVYYDDDTIEIVDELIQEEQPITIIFAEGTDITGTMELVCHFVAEG